MRAHLLWRQRKRRDGADRMPTVAKPGRAPARGRYITRMPCSWRQCVTLFTEELPWLKGRDLDLVMGEALCRWIGWPLPAVGKG